LVGKLLATVGGRVEVKRLSKWQVVEIGVATPQASTKGTGGGFSTMADAVRDRVLIIPMLQSFKPKVCSR
jgi:hypothetical protein